MCCYRPRLLSARGFQIQAEQNLAFVGKISYQFPHRLGELLDESGNSNNLIALRKFGLLVDIDNLQFVGSRKLFFANAPFVRDGPGGARGVAGHIKTEDEYWIGGLACLRAH